MSTPTVEDTCARCQTVLTQMERAVIGKREVLELVLLGLLADGHVLLEGFPGLAKTLDRALVRAGARRSSFARDPVHARPDALRRHRLVDLRPARRAASSSGPGRSSPTCSWPTRSTAPRRRPRRRCSRRCRSGRSRSTGETHPLAPPVPRLATQNPIEYEGTYPLPEAQLDRFLMRIGVGYPDREDEWEVLDAAHRARAGRARARAGRRRARRCSRCSARSSASTSRRRVGRYIVDLVPATRAATRRRRSARARAARSRSSSSPAAAPLLERPRLRRARRREGDRRAGARPPR